MKKYSTPAFHDFPEHYYDLLKHRDNCVLLESTRYEQNNRVSLLFVEPVEVLQIRRVSELADLLNTISKYRRQGYYIAGYFAYECGYHIEKLGMGDYCHHKGPLAWFGVYQKPIRFDHETGIVEGADFHAIGTKDQEAKTPEFFAMTDVHFNLDEEKYRIQIEQIKEYIRAGDVYQVNFTGRYTFNFEGSPLALYRNLKQKQPVAYGAYIRAAGQDILCFSPELFFRIEGQHISTRPMKGTAPRGDNSEEDRQIANWLAKDAKNRAENVMIVDLLRNDLGQLCQTSSVTVPELFTIEQYATLFQMTSTVEGQLRADITEAKVFQSLFPCGSITGAPKIRAMEIIRELEQTPRGVYTGAIGYFAPIHNKARQDTGAIFNVAIRTIILENEHGEMGIGSGITIDSQPQTEYAECLLKANFLTGTDKTDQRLIPQIPQRRGASAPLPSVGASFSSPASSPTFLPSHTHKPDFELLEAILWSNGYQHKTKHLQRLSNTAAFFKYRYNVQEINQMLADLETSLAADQQYKVRLKLQRNGTCQGEAILLPHIATTTIPEVAISAERVHTHNPMLYHKTTDRAHYDQASRYAQKHGYADILFLNEKGEVTEGAISNIFIELRGELLTPSIHCGLLNGIYRQVMLERYPLAKEIVLYLEDLQQAEKIYICNAIRGLREVRLGDIVTIHDV